MKKTSIRLAFAQALFALWGCAPSHKSQSKPADPIPPVAIQDPSAPSLQPTPTATPTSVPDESMQAELQHKLDGFDATSEAGNRGYLQLLCEHQDDLPRHASWYRFVLRSLLNKIDLSRLLVEKDCAYIVSELFKSKRTMDRLEIRYGSDSPDWEILQRLDPQTDFALLNHLKRFIKNLRVVGDEADDKGPLFLEAMLQKSGGFCSIELWTVTLNGLLDLNLDALGGCAGRLMLTQVKLTAASRLMIHAPRGLMTSRLQIRDLNSPAAVLERVSIDPLQTLNALNFTDESSQPLFAASAFNPFLLSSLSGLETFSDFSFRKFKPTDPPYLNLGDTAISDFSQVNTVLISQYLAFIRNNLPASDAGDKAKTCTTLLRFKAIKYQPSWYTQQNWQKLAPADREIFRSLAAGYEESCRAVRDAVVERLQQDAPFVDTCGAPAADLKSFNCKLTGVEFGN